MSEMNYNINYVRGVIKYLILTNKSGRKHKIHDHVTIFHFPCEKKTTTNYENS